MKLFNSFAVLGLALLTGLHLVLCAPTTSSKASTTPCKTPGHTSTTKQTHTHTHTHTSKPPKTTSSNTKDTKTSGPSKTTSKARTTPATSTASGCPAPTVPLGGGGPFATVQGRMFQIQSKTQFFAGIAPYCSYDRPPLTFREERILGGSVNFKAILMSITSFQSLLS